MIMDEQKTQSDKHIKVNYCSIKLEWLIFYAVSQIECENVGQL